MENEELRRHLLIQAGKLPELEKEAEATKVAWKETLLERDAQANELAQKVKKAKGAMDAVYSDLSVATQARNTLRAEFTPKDLQKKETALGLAYRQYTQHRKRAQFDVDQMRQGIELQSRRKGFLPDVETKKREADRMTYLESIVADVSEKEEAAHDAWQAVLKELDDAYGRATRQADEAPA